MNTTATRPRQDTSTVSTTYPVLILGGGTAGVDVAARLRNAGVKGVAIVEPSEQHYYQPAWTLVVGGIMEARDTVRPERDYIPAGVTWVRDRAVNIDPEAQRVSLASGSTVGYDVLVLATGLQLDWNRVEGLTETLGKRRLQQL
jgi:sulfide:quinone oxidoreductase